MSPRSTKSGVNTKPKLKSKLESLLRSDSAFAIENLIEAVLGIVVTLLLIILFAPIIMDLYLASFPSFGTGTKAGAIWANFPYIAVVMLIIFGLLAMVMWFKGGGEGEIMGRV